MQPVSAQFAGQTLEEFKQAFPGARFYGSQFYQPQGVDDESSSMTSIYGTILATGTTPEESAWNHVSQVAPMLGENFGTLVPQIRESGEVTQGVMFNRGTGAHKFHVLRFDQYVNDIPVFRSGAGFLVRNVDGNPLVMSAFDVKDMAGAEISASGRPEVSKAMLGNVAALMNEQPVERSVLKRERRREVPRIITADAEYTVFAGTSEQRAEPELAVQFIASRGSQKTFPDYHKYLIVASASSGEILYSESLICFCSNCMINVQGNVAGRATDGLNALECDPEVSMPLPYAEVSINGGSTVFADANGNFDIPHGGSSSVTVTSRLRGLWFEVFDEANGNATPVISQSVTPPGPVNFLHNPTANNDLMTANVNAYVEANRVRDFVLQYEPTFPVIANQQGFNIFTNIASSCNAFYDGSSINFYQNGGGCNNTSFSDVVHHEYGHHLINVTGNGQGQMGEGSGDVLGVLIQDDPILGQGFSSCGSGIRNANNNKQYPCSGGIHDCGQLISGCVWDTRNQLIVTEPESYIDISAQLFLGMLILRGDMTPGDQTISPFITVLYLELDDDDGNIGNGTPHYNEIAAGFGAHNMDAPPIELLDFNYPNGLPEMIPHTGGVAFDVEVLPVSESPASSSGMLFVDTGSGFVGYPMNEVSTNVYEADFPSAECGDIVRYYVEASTTGGNTQSDPANAPAEYFEALIGSESEFAFADDFESDTGWSVSGNAVDGQWQRGIPAGGGDRGDPATDYDGSSRCYVTDNVDGNSDVDGGSTILTSPVINASQGPNEVGILSYSRWYSNNTGDSPEADVFVVEISNNGGSSWTSLETVGPSGVEVRGGWFNRMFKISDFVAPTSQMRLRFTASDLGGGSIVEAGVDAVQIKMVSCAEPIIVPSGGKTADGVVSSGQLSDVFDSDDGYLAIDPEPTSNPFKQKIEYIVQQSINTATPTQFRFRMEAKLLGGPAGDVLQSMELFNYNTSTFEIVDLRAMAVTDTVVDCTATGDLSRFVSPGTNEITAMVTFNSFDWVGTPFFWSAEVDQIVWIVE
ncbi:MAG: hypothetical protein ACR2NP_10520 [Pirellulaceae bacterium]